MTPLETRQASAPWARNNINSGGRIEPNVVMNPSWTQVRVNKVIQLGHFPPKHLPQQHGEDRQAREGHADGRDGVEISGCVHAGPPDLSPLYRHDRAPW